MAIQSWCQCGLVISVHDGDTFHMVTDQRLNLKVRIAYIDAPENDQPYGHEAQTYLAQRILKKRVCIKIKYKDPYKRSIAEVIVPNNQNLNEQLISGGFAWHYKKYSKNLRLSGLQAEAQKKNVGLWQNRHPVPPWEWRKNHHIGYK